MERGQKYQKWTVSLLDLGIHHLARCLDTWNACNIKKIAKYLNNTKNQKRETSTRSRDEKRRVKACFEVLLLISSHKDLKDR